MALFIQYLTSRCLEKARCCSTFSIQTPAFRQAFSIWGIAPNSRSISKTTSPNFSVLNKVPMIATAVKKRQPKIIIEGSDFNSEHIAIAQMAPGKRCDDHGDDLYRESR